MLGVVAFGVLLVVTVDRLYGHSTIAFAAAILLLLIANVILFLLIAVIILPLTWWFNKREVDL